jgi:hypothetical protein
MEWRILVKYNLNILIDNIKRNYYNTQRSNIDNKTGDIYYNKFDNSDPNVNQSGYLRNFQVKIIKIK